MSLANIDHFVYLMLENRSFDHMLGYLSLPDTPNSIALDGLTNDPAWANYDSDGNRYRPKRLDGNASIQDPPHGLNWVPHQIDTPAEVKQGPRRMGGFVHTYLKSREAKKKTLPKDPGAVMHYYDHKAVWAYHSLAQNYCVCDRWFTPLPTGTQPNRLMAMAGYSKIRRNKRFPLDKHDLVYKWLDRLGDDKWAVYMSHGILPFFALMPDWWDEILDSKVGSGSFRHLDRLREDWAPGGTVPPVVFVEPAYSEFRGDRANDDHAPVRITGGQALVADLYDVLTSNPQRWARTLLIITYDEHGGFADHAEPLRIRQEFDGKPPFTNSGPRVPALLVSPYVRPRQVFSESLDHTAFLSLLAEKFTPGKPYSPQVEKRQQSFEGTFGRLANALAATPRTETPPAIPRPLGLMVRDGVKSLTGFTPPGLNPADRPPDSKTPTTSAFHDAALRTAEKRPELLADPEWKGLATAAAKPEPVVEDDEFIPDA